MHDTPTRHASRFVSLIAFGWAAAAAGADKPVHIEYTPRDNITVLLAITATTTNLKVSDWIWYAPKPPETESQRNITASLVKDGEEIQEGSDRHQTVLFARYQNDPKLESDSGVQLIITATLYKR